MVVVSLFIKKILWDEFGGLIWLIINEFFILFGFIGEVDEVEKVEIGGVIGIEKVEFLEKNGKVLLLVKIIYVEYFGDFVYCGWVINSCRIKISCGGLNMYCVNDEILLYCVF